MDDRRAKLERLREQGVDPFPHQFEGVVATSEIVDDLEPGQETDRAYRVAGRMVARRDQGGAGRVGDRHAQFGRPRGRLFGEGRGREVQDGEHDGQNEGTHCGSLVTGRSAGLKPCPT